MPIRSLLSLLLAGVASLQAGGADFEILLKRSNGTIPLESEILNSSGDEKWKKAVSILQNRQHVRTWRAALVSLGVLAKSENERRDSFAQFLRILSVPTPKHSPSDFDLDFAAAKQAVPIALGYLARNSTDLQEPVPAPIGQAISIQNRTLDLLVALALGKAKSDGGEKLYCDSDCQIKAVRGLKIVGSEMAISRLDEISNIAASAEIRHHAYEALRQVKRTPVAKTR